MEVNKTDIEGVLIIQPNTRECEMKKVVVWDLELGELRAPGLGGAEIILETPDYYLHSIPTPEALYFVFVLFPFFAVSPQ